jgi:hypothetical protein
MTRLSEKPASEMNVLEHYGHHTTDEGGRVYLYGHGYLKREPYDDFPQGAFRLLRKPRSAKHTDHPEQLLTEPVR